MPLFACDKCNTVENTALGDYWVHAGKDEPVLCSECSTGTWHGRFPKERADSGNWEPDRGRFLRRKPLTPDPRQRESA
jgi:hypothetical protein